MLSIAIYDPRRLDEDTFLTGFVARRDIANFLLEQLGQLSPSQEAIHRILVGQRGMGKTSLLRRVAIGVQQDAELSARYAPLTFREEQYNVRDIHRFWRNCGEALAEWLEQSGNSKLAADIDCALQSEKWSQGGAREAFLSLMSSLNKRPVLLVDNLDLVLDAIPEEQHWELRRVLQSKNGPILYGASTQFLRQSSDQNAAFYEFFQIHQLEPLTEGELIQCMYQLVAARGVAGRPVKAILDREPERLRVLHNLTGGNPRVLVLIYQLLERSESESVFADLEVLLDQLTPFYKSRIEELTSDVQRAVIDAIALNWDPITTNKLANITGIEATTLSPQLQRLRNHGLIEEVPTSGARAGYQIVERFLNIWYLMRHGTRRARHRMRWLTAFLQSFYSIDQLKQLHATIGGSGTEKRWHPFYNEAIAEALKTANIDISIGVAVDALNNTSKEMRRAPSSDKRQVTETDLRTAIELKPDSGPAWVNLGEFLARSGKRAEEAEAAYRRAIEIEPISAAAWRQLAHLLRDLPGRYDESEKAYRHSIELDPQSASAWVGLGRLLSLQFHKYEEAEAAYRRSIDLNDKYDVAWFELAMLLQHHLYRYDEAEQAFRRLTEIDQQDATAWHHLGRLLHSRPERHEDAENAYRRTVEIDPDHAMAWFELGDLLTHRVHRYKEAEEVFRQGAQINPKEDFLWAGLVHVLGVHLDRTDEAEKTFKQAIEAIPQSSSLWATFGDMLGRALHRFVEGEEALRRATEIEPKNARAWDDLGDLLRHLKREPEAESAYRQAIAARTGYLSPTLSLADLLRKQNRYDEAESLWRRFVEVRPNSADAWQELGGLLRRVNRYEEAEDAYRRALKINPKSASVWANVGILHSDRKRHDEAETAIRRAIEIDSENMYNWAILGQALVSADRLKEAEVAFRRGIEIEPNAAKLWISLGRLLEQSDRCEEAEAAFRRAIEINPADQDPWYLLGNLMQDHLCQFKDAEDAYARAIDISKGSLVTKANLFWLYIRTEKMAEAERLRQELSELEKVGLRLADAGLEIARDNFGTMTDLLSSALSEDVAETNYFDDLLRLLRLVEQRGYGDRLIDWWETSGHAVTHAPIYAAFVALVRGPRALLDFNPEVRKTAERIYSWLFRGHLRSSEEPNKKLTRPRGRRRKRGI